MTRKDFRLIAETLRKIPLGPRERRKAAAHFADALAATNSNFDMRRFLMAVLSQKDT